MTEIWSQGRKLVAYYVLSANSLHCGGKIKKMKEHILKYIPNICLFENFQLLVKQYTIRLVYMSVIKVAVLNCSFPLYCVGVRRAFLWILSYV